ncbi:MAG: type I-B CRISPR-associated protein Cas7/Cst2/DevR [Candidatus Omnitrophica bacterium]|nr:type I-B CRISPR-associated protein Cas7/Cst2/DevR [Candidatus Omnitrophota bacterium]
MNNANNTQTSSQNSRKYIVMDIVFYGSSLNYDQGTSNYQELKKITKWDGRQYTLVSRYALRYSLLKTAEDLGLWRNAPGTILERAGEGEKTVIQPSIRSLLSGEILTYPEFDFFGYLITGTTPQNNREAPVKISHAISMTPYNYDSHFSGNLGYAKRMVEAGVAEKMDANLFTVEEHQTYYIYTIVIDINRIGRSEIYLYYKDKDIKKENNILVEEAKDKSRKEINIVEEVNFEVNKLDKLFVIEYSLKDLNIRQKRIDDLIRAVLNLNRNIKARNESLRPKLLILGIYKNAPYKTLKDRIILANEFEEIYEEIAKPEDKGVKITRKIVKLERPTFKILGGLPGNPQPQILENEETILGNIQEQNNNQNITQVYIYHTPEIKVYIEN